ncbi:hypothetical protein ABAC460_17090 [Asticcacaulis sp. AC460]|uniref:hypothetical protein n=1 Tax=Asticcacaulis sp. AC460 TaxID=1282360 RepID=UPI0003C3B768|nr:hypothetical protein [Asticcacaulis sp. AC460]ESQ87906.1 hypothetical protein ABAC460_17090 [Asticcacaulis sp. AC460]
MFENVSWCATKPDGLNRPMITLSVMLATVIQALDGTIANVALPHIQGSLNACQDQITWVLTSFIVAVAIATPVTGPLRRVLTGNEAPPAPIHSFVANRLLPRRATVFMDFMADVFAEIDSLNLAA